MLPQYLDRLDGGSHIFDDAGLGDLNFNRVWRILLFSKEFQQLFAKSDISQIDRETLIATRKWPSPLAPRL